MLAKTGPNADPIETFLGFKMLIFGLCFILYFLKLSAGIGFWSKLRRTDPHTTTSSCYKIPTVSKKIGKGPVRFEVPV